MKQALRIAGFGLLAGAGLTMAVAGVANAHGRGGPGMQGAFGPGGPDGQRGGLAQTFAELDANSDGKITEEDLRALAEARFSEVDLDGSGTIGADELAAVMEARMAERMGDRMGERAPNRRDPVARITAMAERMVDARDANGDGVLSMAELEPANGFGRMIDRFDTDDDNAIDKAEYDAARAEFRQRMTARGERGGDGQKGGWRGGHHDGPHGGKFGGRNN